ncbi:MAG: GIY-YIG nuclease family protein [Burkholderiaceae bacterium]|nr:GIY-YIG nuclease family protein [Burkholderiaceae bacterium]
MKAFELLKAIGGRVTASNCKVHLACFNGSDDPMDEYHAGTFDDWQAWQTRRNFSKETVISVIRLQEPDKWLFVGCYEIRGCVQNTDKVGVTYDMARIPEYEVLVGRLVVGFRRSGRQSYILGSTAAPDMTVLELKAQPLTVPDFNGFKNVRLPFRALEAVIECEAPAWRSALSSVSGVYLITDPLAGKLYVGSASGSGGIWRRWCDYTNGHGDNKMLRELVSADGIARAHQFTFSVLEVGDVNTDMVSRENHWKGVLLTRTEGYNASEGKRKLPADAASDEAAS